MENVVKILIDCSNLKTGGAIQCGLSFLSRASYDKRHQFIVAVSAELNEQIPDYWKRNFEDYIILPYRKGLFGIFRLRKIMNKYEKLACPHIVFSMFGPAYWRPKAVHVCGFAIPHFLYPEIDIFKNVGNKILYMVLKIRLFFILKFQKILFRMPDYLIVETQVVKNRCAKTIKFPIDNIFVIKNSFSNIFKEKMIKNTNTINCRKKSDNFFKLLVPSAYYSHKNLEFIPKVAFILKNRGYNDFVFYLTIPKDHFGWLNLTMLISRLHVENHIISFGSIRHEELAEAYLKCDAVFLPTLMECSTAVYPEAMAAGVPILTSDLDFAHDSCGEAALYFNPNDAKQAAEKIAQLIKNYNLRISLVDAGYKELEKRYPSPEEKYENQILMLNEIYNNNIQDKKITR